MGSAKMGGIWGQREREREVRRDREIINLEWSPAPHTKTKRRERPAKGERNEEGGL
jgi:hypothetical protein